MVEIADQIRAAAGAGFQVIYADPAWRFASNSEKNPGRNAMRHYRTMKVEEIAAIPVKDCIADQAICFMWITGPFLAIGAHIQVMKAWGFKPKAVGFTWVKLQKNHRGDIANLDRDFFVNTGMTTRKNCELCMIGTRGKSLRKSGAVRELGVYPRMEHSRKPDEFRTRIEQYVGPGIKMAELFCRQAPEGWTPFGDEIGKFE